MRLLRSVVAVFIVAGSLAACSRDRQPAVIVGVPKTTSPPATRAPARVAAKPARRPLPPPRLGRPETPEPGPAIGLAPANGRPFRPAIPFRSAWPVPDELQFVLVVGSDARRGEDLRRARADSIHLLAVNPRSRQGTVVGFPRDSWVEIPGRGKGKINDALVKGGPDLLAETVRRLTGLPVHFYVLTAFDGMIRIVDALGGIDVFVARRMNDRASGARFEPGWHHFDGHEALAYSRNRNDTRYGDFSRSQHQGDVILAALAKMRAEVADDDGVRTWFRLLLSRDVALDVPRDRLPQLGALARRLDPEAIENLVLPGRVGTAGGQSVVYLDDSAKEIFADLRPDAVRGEEGPPVSDEPEDERAPTPTPTPTSTTVRLPRSTTSTTSTTQPE